MVRSASRLLSPLVFLLLLLALPAPAHAQVLNILKPKVGDQGEMVHARVTIYKILDDNQLVVEVHPVGQKTDFYFVLRCPTKGFADDQRFDDDWKRLCGSNVLKITDTLKTKSKTMFVLEPVDPEKKDKP